MTPLCAICGRRPAKALRIRKGKSSSAARRGAPARLKGHDCCLPCWRGLVSRRCGEVMAAAGLTGRAD